jgi:hypothetical protein
MQERAGSSTYLGSADELMRQRNNAEHRSCSNKRRQMAAQQRAIGQRRMSGRASLRARCTESTHLPSGCGVVRSRSSWQSGPLLHLCGAKRWLCCRDFKFESFSCFRLDSASGPCTKPFPSAALRVSFTDDDAAIAVELSLPIVPHQLNTKPLCCRLFLNLPPTLHSLKPSWV